MTFQTYKKAVEIFLSGLLTLPDVPRPKPILPAPHFAAFNLQQIVVAAVFVNTIELHLH